MASSVVPPTNADHQPAGSLQTRTATEKLKPTERIEGDRLLPMPRPIHNPPKLGQPVNRLLLFGGLFLACVAQASGEAVKIEKLHGRGKLDKAWELCQSLEANPGAEFAFARDTCAQVDRERLALVNPSGLGRAQLDAHAQHWSGTPAGEASKEQAAQIFLREAGQTVEKLNQVTWTYQRTQAAQEAQARIWQIEYDRAKLLASPEAYTQFRNKYPDSPQVEEALEKEKEAAFDRAMSTGTAEAMQLFMASYPDSPNVERAQKLEMDYAFHEAGKAGTSEAWHELYKNFVAHPRRHEIQGRWYASTLAEVETRGVAPLLLYSAVHPSDQAARIALEAAVIQSVSVSMIAGHPDHPGWQLPREGEVSVPRVSQLSAAVQVRFPHVSNQSPEIRILAEKGNDIKSLQSHLQSIFKLTPEEATNLAIQWRSPEEGVREARLPVGLCQPRGTRFVVEVQLMGQKLRFPFRSDTPCADWWVPMATWSGSARKGGRKSIGAWSGIAGELPPLPWKNVWWTGARFEHAPLQGTGTVVTWPDGTRYWRPGKPGINGRNLEEILLQVSFPAPGFEMQSEGPTNLLRIPGGDKVEIAAGLKLEHTGWLAGTKPPGQGRPSGALGPETGWIVAETTGAFQPLPPEGGTELDLRQPTPQILKAWSEQIRAMTDETTAIRWSAMIDLDLDDELEGVVCLGPGVGNRCFVADWRDGGPAWFQVMGFEWPATVSQEPFAFWNESGVYLALVDNEGVTTARYTGSAYQGSRDER